MVQEASVQFIENSVIRRDELFSGKNDFPSIINHFDTFNLNDLLDIYNQLFCFSELPSANQAHLLDYIYYQYMLDLDVEFLIFSNELTNTLIDKVLHIVLGAVNTHLGLMKRVNIPVLYYDINTELKRCYILTKRGSLYEQFSKEADQPSLYTLWNPIQQ